MAAVIPNTAGKGNSTVKTQNVPENSKLSSESAVKKSGITGIYSNLGADIKNINGYDVLNFSLAPGASLITNQETMSYMDGGLVTEAQLGRGGIWEGLKRGITGSSVLQNMVSNPTTSVRKITLSPLLQGSIVQIDIKSGETWRFADKSFIASTPNLTVSGNLNIFSNFRMMFVNENATYNTVKADQGSDGTVWISSFGGVVKHEMTMGTEDTVPLFINNGCFLGMLDNNGTIDFWDDYVDIGTANGLFSAMFTQLGWVMKIQDNSKNPGPVKLTVLTQSLNPHNFERYIANIAHSVAKTTTSAGTGFLTSGVIIDSTQRQGSWFGSQQNVYRQNVDKQNWDWSQQNVGQQQNWGWGQQNMGQQQNWGSGGTRKNNRKRKGSKTYHRSRLI